MSGKVEAERTGDVTQMLSCDSGRGGEHKTMGNVTGKSCTFLYKNTKAATIR